MMDDCAAHPDDDVMHAEHCAVFALVPADMATHISVANGSWFTPSTWNTGTVPGAGARVFVDSGYTVTYDAISNTEIDWLRVKGTLNFSTGASTQLKLNTCIIDPVGIMNIGTALTPVAAAVTAKIIFSDNGPIDITMDPFEFGKGLISHGMLTVNGAYKKSYCAINKNLNAGAASLKLSETPTGWAVGDQIIVPGTYGTAAGDFITNTKFHDEILTITSIAGKTVYFTNTATGGTTLQYEHKMPIGYGLKMYVANITRNVRIETENYAAIPVDQRAHVMLMHNTAQNISNAALIGLGRSNKDILVTDPVVNEFGEQIAGGSNVRGRYALHVHRAGTNDPAASALVIKGNAVVDPTSWGIVNHQSHVYVDDNVVFNYFGAAFITEDGNELGRFNRNMAIKGRKATTVTDLEMRTANFDFGFEGNGFWIQSSNVSFENNIVTSSAGDAYKVFSDDASMPDARRLKIPAANILNPVIAGADDSIYTAVVPMRKFAGNVAYNCNSAMMFWTHMLNNDNVGDFSTVEYDPYTHTIMSVIDNCKFWNMQGAGISVKYSGQVHFRNTLLLGDIAGQFATSDWIIGNPYGGFAFITSTVTGQMVYEGLTVKGWKRALVAGRTDDLQSADGFEYNYRTSKVIGGTYGSNVYNIVPEEGTDIYGASEYYRFPDYFEISSAPIFSVITPNITPVADYAYVAIGGTAVNLNGALSADADPGVITPGQGNGIAGYVWQFGDGTVGYGKEIVHIYPAPGTYATTLTVYDSQGQTGTVTKNVYVAATPYENIVENSGFETGTLQASSYINSTAAFVDNAWIHKSNWQIVDGKAVIYLSDKWNRPLVQVIRNDKALRGVVELSFQAKNLGIGAIGNDLICEITGVNTEFRDLNFITPASVEQWNNNEPGFTADVLYSQNVGLANYNWQTFTADVDLGTGYTYIIVKFYSQGVKVGPAEEQGVDNVCLPCICSTPGGLFEDELTATHAMLIWDNVGSMQYDVQYKTTTGGAWTTVTVNNTFLELSALSANTSYTWKVRAQCDGVYTAYSAEKIFITPAAGTTCTSPNVLSTELITSNKATLVWNVVPTVLQYQVAYKTAAAATWTTQNVAVPTLMLTGLTPSTTYQWKVRAQCAAGWKDYTSVMEFTTPALRMEEEAATADEWLTIVPNPATEVLHCTIREAQGGGMLRLLSMAGQTVRQEYIPATEGETVVSISLAWLPVGVYVMTYQLADGIVASQKVVIQ